MNKHLYQKNLFLQKTKEKYNPDVLKKKEEFDKNRKVNIFKKSNVTYNPITNNTPTNITNQKDLELTKDTVIPDLNKVITQKKKEREDQELTLKPLKQKIVDNPLQKEEVVEFIDLKSEQTKYMDTHNKCIQTNKNKYDDIMNNLKILGIIN
jgi:hypothetical protein